MAGGMNKRGRWGSMEDRLAAGRASDQRAASATAPPPGARQPPPQPEPQLQDLPVPPEALKHVWVTDRHGRLPGLLLEWRQATPGAAWEGHVVRLIHEGPDGDDPGGWAVVTEWLHVGLLDQA